MYCGASQGNATSNIVISNNRFSRRYYPRGGKDGPAVFYGHGRKRQCLDRQYVAGQR